MAQPVTALLDPEPDDNRPMPDCPDFCDGTCAEWNDEDGGMHHTSGFRDITLADCEHGQPIGWLVSASRTDEEFRAGTADVTLIASHGNGASMTPAEARQLAGMLLDAASLADPQPHGSCAVAFVEPLS